MRKRLLAKASAALAISGIILTMCEAQDFKGQLILATVGITMACVGGYFLCSISKN